MCRELAFAGFCCWIICPGKLLCEWMSELEVYCDDGSMFLNDVPGRKKKRTECSVSSAVLRSLNQQRCRRAQQRRYLRIVVLVELQKTGENCGVLFKVLFQGQTTDHSWHNLHKSGSLQLKHTVSGVALDTTKFVDRPETV